MLALVVLAGGCAIVPQNRRAHLADPIMAFTRAPISQDFLDHVFESREGSRGATGGSGGGCGCN